MSNKKSRRQDEIIKLLRHMPSIRVNEMAEELHVTAETIRRDLDEMNDKGLLERTHGGAILHMKQEPGLNIRHNMLVREREEIARWAVQEIKGAKHLMIGSGATTVHIARRIASDLKNITAIVHSFGVASELSHNPTIDVIMAPGHYDSGEGANHGVHTLAFLENFWVDYAILGASGLDPEGPCEALIDAGAVYSKMISRAFQSIIATDKTKYGMKFPSRFAGWNDIDMLIVDEPPPGDLKINLAQQGVTVRIAAR
jgi:DeoR/GlpR family transcriptional regulator of sugar metabolism